MWYRKKNLPLWGLGVLIFSTMFFSTSLVGAQSFSDDAWMKERLARIHARYTGAGDHDQFLYKLQQAEKKVSSVQAREAILQIILWREELRPTVVRGGVSSIPPEFVTQSTGQQKGEENNQDEDRTPESVLVPEQNRRPSAVPVVTHDRYQLVGGFIDIATLQETRLQRVNDLRVSRGRHQLSLHPLLHKTAADRSETMKKNESVIIEDFLTAPIMHMAK